MKTLYITTESTLNLCLFCFPKVTGGSNFAGYILISLMHLTAESNILCMILKKTHYIFQHCPRDDYYNVAKNGNHKELKLKSS